MKLFSSFRRMVREVPPIVAALMILSVVGMNLLANKSIDTGLSWLALDCGILFSWLAYLSMDILTHCCGPKVSSAMSVMALLLNLFMVLIFFIASRIPGVWGESFVEGSEGVINTALDRTFGGTWYILLGSSIAFLASAFINSFLNYGIGKFFKKELNFGEFAVRSYVSTFVAQFADNMIFALIVSKVFFGWSLLQCFTCALTGAVLELVFEVVFSPVGYRISKRMMRDKINAAIAETGERA